MGKLGMKEIMQLFRRDAEHDPVSSRDAAKYDLGSKPRILKESTASGTPSASASRSGTSSRETTAPRERERERTPPFARNGEGARKEDSVFGRRW